MQKTKVRPQGREDVLEKGMATHSSVLPWKIQWTEEPNGMQFCKVAKELDIIWWLTNKHPYAPTLELIRLCTWLLSLYSHPTSAELSEILSRSQGSTLLLLIYCLPSIFIKLLTPAKPPNLCGALGPCPSSTQTLSQLKAKYKGSRMMRKAGRNRTFRAKVQNVDSAQRNTVSPGEF